MSYVQVLSKDVFLLVATCPMFFFCSSLHLITATTVENVLSCPRQNVFN